MGVIVGVGVWAGRQSFELPKAMQLYIEMLALALIDVDFLDSCHGSSVRSTTTSTLHHPHSHSNHFASKFKSKSKSPSAAKAGTSPGEEEEDGEVGNGLDYGEQRWQQQQQQQQQRLRRHDAQRYANFRSAASQLERQLNTHRESLVGSGGWTGQYNQTHFHQQLKSRPFYFGVVVPQFSHDCDSGDPDPDPDHDSDDDDDYDEYGIYDDDDDDDYGVEQMGRGRGRKGAECSRCDACGRASKEGAVCVEVCILSRTLYKYTVPPFYVVYLRLFLHFKL